MRFIVLALLVASLVETSALAHDLGVECNVRGDKLVVKAYFDDGTRAAGSKVEVFGDLDQLVQEGQTDDQGEWRCPTPGPGDYSVVVDDGHGHRRRIIFTIPLKTGDGRVSPGPTEEEFTAFPWLKLSIGVGALLAFALVTWFLNRQKQGSREQELG